MTSHARRRNFAATVRFVARLAVLSWGVDVAFRAAFEPGAVLAGGRGLLAGLGLSLVGALLAGSVAAAFVAFALGELGLDEVLPRVRRSARSFACEGDARQQHARIALLLATPLTLLAFALLSLRLTSLLLLHVARPENIARLSLLGHLALAVASVLLFFSLRGAFLAGAGWVFASGRWGARLAQTRVVLAALLIVGALLFVTLVVTFSYELAHVPWTGPLKALIALSLTALATRFGPKLETRASAFALVATCVLCAAAGVTIDHEDAASRTWLEEHLDSAAPGLWLSRKASDFDADGYAPIYGGGDCRPFDHAIHPGAIEIPDNAVDEDCDGADLAVALLMRRAAKQHPLPSNVSRRPPVVLITLDAFASSRLTVHGSKRKVAKELEQLAEQSVFFTRCFSQGPSTRLSIPSLFTSRYDSQILREMAPRHPFPLAAKNELLAEVLRARGYRTVAVVPDAYFLRWQGLAQGFDTYVREAAQAVSETPHKAKLVTDLAIEQLGSHDDKRPVFLWAHYFDTHSPHAQPPDVPVFGKTFPDIYDAEMAYMDRHVGRLLRAVDERFDGKALVIVTADHGFGFIKPRYARSGYGQDLHTITLHVPLIFKAPYLTKRRVDSLSSTMDVMPTLLNLLSIPPNKALRGHSLVPELFGTGKRPQVVFSQFFLKEYERVGKDPLKLVGVRTPQYNMVLDRSTGKASLWDFTADYAEQHDLYGSDDEKVRAQRSQLKQLLSAFVYETHGKARAQASEAAKPAAQPGAAVAP